VAGLPESSNTLYAGELEIRLGEGLVLANGYALTLSVREFDLLVAMARRTGAIITRRELYRTVWGGSLRAGDRSVDVYVSKLRVKLEAAMPDRRFIHTHPGFGYRFQPRPTRETAGEPHTTAGISGSANADSSTPGIEDGATPDVEEAAIPTETVRADTRGVRTDGDELSRDVHIEAPSA
jgi:DNA-binding winged helix-turn-helix (wHTH) protein